ncbi:copper chaperone PCu(A)C [Fodinibius sp.]|uniref:copper chaperone PCu(A)C n=1 Tax=Fodinibius sp. TaxID=1872440 RepID=UPI002ACD9229|nr:copper chaperone PCu(A)C [Fodinibius sp.]MDZ7658307.1 copper chaperone PCu(A)C [Fodinibius sp.]
MKPIKHLLPIFLSCCFLFLGCGSESNSSDESGSTKEVVLGKITLDNAWARPGSQQGKSAAYLRISNGTASTDTLLSFSSEAAEKIELHESIEHDDGTISMQPAGQQVIPSGEKLRLQPGGLHLMLINLKRDIAVGDSLKLSLKFARVGTITATTPVQIQN